MHLADFDGDGDQDLVVGNLGHNSQLNASLNEPIELFSGDFDESGSLDPLLCYYIEGQSYPFVSRDDLLNQLPGLKKKFLFFKDYAHAQINDILTADQLEKAKKHTVTTLKTSYFENTGTQFREVALPIEAQIAPVHAIQSSDVNKDGHLDLILSGNMMQVRVKMGRLDGNHGQVYLGNGKGQFDLLPPHQTGLNVKGATRKMQFINTNTTTHLLFGVNDDELQIMELNDE